MIANNGICKHSNGSHLSFCHDDFLYLRDELKYSIAECEAYCTDHASCVGYSYSAKYGCYLFPSDGNCPPNFVYEEGRNTIYAETINDLTANPSSIFVCYGKIPGKWYFTHQTHIQ